MSSINTSFLIILIFFVFTNCGKTAYEKDYSNLLESVPANKYYPNDIVNQKYSNIYGTWKVIGTSGGFAGSGYKSDFDYLILKPNLIFGIIRNDSLVTYGKIEIKSQTDNELYVDFISTDNPDNANIEMVQDSEKYIQINNDTLNLNAPCCDRFNTHLKKAR